MREGKCPCCPIFPSRGRQSLTKSVNQQIEQFIESIFPTQDPKKIAAGQEAAKGQPGMDTVEAFFLILSALSTLVLIGLLMVRPLPFLPGARDPRFSAPLWSLQEKILS